MSSCCVYFIISSFPSFAVIYMTSSSFWNIHTYTCVLVWEVRWKATHCFLIHPYIDIYTPIHLGVHLIDNKNFCTLSCRHCEKLWFFSHFISLEMSFSPSPLLSRRCCLRFNARLFTFQHKRSHWLFTFTRSKVSCSIFLLRFFVLAIFFCFCEKNTATTTTHAFVSYSS